MTLEELKDAIEGLPQRPSNTPIYVEDERGELHDLWQFEVEMFDDEAGEGRLVMKFSPEVADV